MPADGPPVSPWVTGAMQEGFVSAARSQLTAARAMGHYLGRPKLPLITRPGESSDNTLVSPARAIVDKGATALFGQEVLIQIDHNPGAEAYLKECWRRTKRSQKLMQWAINGGVCGTAYLRLIDQNNNGLFPRIVVLDSLNVTVDFNPEDYEDVWRFIIAPPAMDNYGNDPGDPGKYAERHRTIISNASGDAGYSIPQGANRWTITDQIISGGDWKTTAQQVWPYPFCPIIWAQNVPSPNNFFGMADLDEALCHLLDSLNRIASMWNKTIRLFSSPKVYASGLGPRTIDMAADQILYLPSDQAQLKVLEMQSDSASLQALYDRLLQMISMQARVPLVALGLPDQQGPLSGVSLALRWRPLIDKTEAKRMCYGDALQELDRRLLMMAGLGDDVMSELIWPDIMPSDPLSERQIAVIDDSLGIVSKHTIAKRLGFDPSFEQEQMAKEREQAAAQNVALAPLAEAAGQPQLVPGQVPPPMPLGAPAPDVAKGISYS